MKRRIPRLGATGRFLLGLAGVLAGLLVVGGAWWSLAPGPRIIILEPWASTRQIQISRDGRTLASQRSNGIHLWDTSSWQVRALVADGQDLRTHQPLLLSPDGQSMAFCDVDGNVFWWHADVCREPVFLLEAGSQLNRLNHDGNILITDHVSGCQLWNMQTGQRLPLPPDIGELVKPPECLSDGRVVGIDKIPGDFGLRVWELTGQGLLGVVQEAEPPAAVSPDGRLLVAQIGQTVKLWDVQTGSEIATLQRENHPYVGPAGCRFSRDGTKLIVDLSGPMNGLCLWVWDVGTQPSFIGHRVFFDRQLALWIGEERADRYFGVAPDNTTRVFRPSKPLASNLIHQLIHFESAEAAYVIWDNVADRQLAYVPDAECFAYFPDGKAIAIGKLDGTIEIWDIPPRRPVLIDYGLPLLFAVLLFLGGWHIRRWRKRMTLVAETPVLAN